MIGLRRVSRGRTNAAVLFAQERLEREGFIGGISPKLSAYARVQVLRKRFGESVSERLDHDCRIIVIR